MESEEANIKKWHDILLSRFKEGKWKSITLTTEEFDEIPNRVFSNSGKSEDGNWVVFESVKLTVFCDLEEVRLVKLDELTSSKMNIPKASKTFKSSKGSSRKSSISSKDKVDSVRKKKKEARKEPAAKTYTHKKLKDESDKKKSIRSKYKEKSASNSSSEVKVSKKKVEEDVSMKQEVNIENVEQDTEIITTSVNKELEKKEPIEISAKEFFAGAKKMKSHSTLPESTPLTNALTFFVGIKDQEATGEPADVERLTNWLTEINHWCFMVSETVDKLWKDNESKIKEIKILKEKVKGLTDENASLKDKVNQMDNDLDEQGIQNIQNNIKRIYDEAKIEAKKGKNNYLKNNKFLDKKFQQLKEKNIKEYKEKKTWIEKDEWNKMNWYDRVMLRWKFTDTHQCLLPKEEKMLTEEQRKDFHEKKRQWRAMRSQEFADKGENNRFSNDYRKFIRFCHQRTVGNSHFWNLDSYYEEDLGLEIPKYIKKNNILFRRIRRFNPYKPRKFKWKNRDPKNSDSNKVDKNSQMDEEKNLN